MQGVPCLDRVCLGHQAKGKKSVKAGTQQVLQGTSLSYNSGSEAPCTSAAGSMKYSLFLARQLADALGTHMTSLPESIIPHHHSAAQQKHKATSKSTAVNFLLKSPLPDPPAEH
jgi:hypothetical protein